ncbi:hypothetical protein E2C01_019190 [Portunus trituberculatus]|uniref:Uncharacterized protein n=1 Tax=Portunus trituberculatus TaxID=210409 RepID=A0A5B7DWY2_PORTR|nr:hypothetical protein [Portunus trituberculatus]
MSFTVMRNRNTHSAYRSPVAEAAPARPTLAHAIMQKTELETRYSFLKLRKKFPEKGGGDIRASVCPSWHLHILGQLASPLVESVVMRVAAMLGPMERRSAFTSRIDAYIEREQRIAVKGFGPVTCGDGECQEPVSTNGRTRQRWTRFQYPEKEGKTVCRKCVL